MAFDFNKVIIDESIASSTNNFNNPTSSRIKDGIKENSDFKSITLNTLLYKLSNSINYIQKNGAIQYIKGKKYSINSIISVIFLDTATNILHSTLLRCVSTNNDNYCDVIPNVNYTEDENGNIIFNGNNWNTTYWVELSKNGETDLTLSVPDFEFNYQNNAFSRDNSQVKSVELFDFSNIAEDDYAFVNFTLNINRYNNIFCNCILSGNSKNIKFQIETISNISNTIKFGSSGFWYDNSIFKDLAVNGMFFSIDEVNAKLYLHYLGAEVMNKAEFPIRLYINKGNIPLKMELINLADFIDNNNYVILPFIKGVSNVFSNKCGSILDYAYTLNDMEMFRNGLIELNQDKKLDKWLYPIFRKLEYNNFQLYNVLKRYRINLIDGSRYKDRIFPNIIGKGHAALAQNDGCSGAYYNTNELKYYCENNIAGAYSGYLAGKTDTSRDNSDGYNSSNYLHYLYKTIDPNSGSASGWTEYTGPLNASNFFNSDKNEPDRLTTASIKTIPYMKIW